MIDDGNDMQPPSGDDAELRPAERALVAALRAPLPASDGFDARVMTAVRREHVHGAALNSGSRRGLFSGVAAVAALAAVMAILIVRRETAAPVPVEQRSPIAVAPPHSHTVRFTLVASGASHVSVAGSFNGWNIRATPLRRVGNDTWATDIPLGAGRYVYQFVIDGKRWTPDPRAPRDAGDDFGATNSVVTVATSGSA
jgi:AMP-activated protein kinase-like protein